MALTSAFCMIILIYPVFSIWIIDVFGCRCATGCLLNDLMNWKCYIFKFFFLSYLFLGERHTHLYPSTCQINNVAAIRNSFHFFRLESLENVMFDSIEWIQTVAVNWKSETKCNWLFQASTDLATMDGNMKSKWWVHL